MNIAWSRDVDDVLGTHTIRNGSQSRSEIGPVGHQYLDRDARARPGVHRRYHEAAVSP